MKLAKAIDDRQQVYVVVWEDQSLFPLQTHGRWLTDLSEVLEHNDPAAFARSLKSPNPIPLANVTILAPIDRQEVWAAGVTYKRSKSARMEESETAADCYDRVYRSPRPELFFKASPHRVAGPHEPLRIRYDSKWNVPEPELTLVMNSRLELVGFTIGNDMSSRDIEGDNPLYLPQAKVYDQCCGLGPCITLADSMPTVAEIEIALQISRGEQVVFADRISVDQMARSFEELIGWLGRDQSFPNGVLMLTGTGIVPAASFTLAVDDVVSISITGIGTLTNRIVQFGVGG
ncbi:MAG: fumarylacetoacetate hydrolase family protein [Planctomycetaceae bacterium]|nr:fumarylacetoacetate hydrolase family protein [Planctomycetaceae bacterium]